MMVTNRGRVYFSFTGLILLIVVLLNTIENQVDEAWSFILTIAAVLLGLYAVIKHGKVVDLADQKAKANTGKFLRLFVVFLALSILVAGISSYLPTYLILLSGGLLVALFIWFLIVYLRGIYFDATDLRKEISQSPLKSITFLAVIIGFSWVGVWALNNYSPNQQQNLIGQEDYFDKEQCWENLYFDKPELYDIWKIYLSQIHPEYKIYDSGSLCNLTNGNYIISYSYFASSDPKSGAQAIALFDTNYAVVNEAFIKCRSIGDLAVPRFNSISDGSVVLTCNSVDAGHRVFEEYSLNLQTFELTTLQKESILPI